MFKTGEMYQTAGAVIEIIDAWQKRKGGKLLSLYQIYYLDKDIIQTATAERLSAILNGAKAI